MVSRTGAQRSRERAFFRALNRVVEPLVRAGAGSARLAPGGLIVLETRGRHEGGRAFAILAPVGAGARRGRGCP